FALGDRHVGFYLLDVSGHGVAASLTAVAAARMMSAPGDPDSLLCDRATGAPLPPARVLGQLNERFTFNGDTGQFLTCFYAVLDTATRVLCYACAGHPGPIWVNGDGVTQSLDATGLPVGIGEEQYEERCVTLAPRDRVYVHSDGIIESRSPDGSFFGLARLASLVADVRAVPLLESVARIERDLAAFRGGKPAGDDVSLLAIECS
ncbi:serine/threonine-protein phosphatase, partial [bacterium]